MKKSLSKIVGNNIKVLLNNKKLTQEEAAFMLNVEERTLRRWIKDGVNKISTIELICSVFQIDDIVTLFKDYE